MAIKTVRGWFSKTGKGFPQVELKNFDGTPMVKDGKPVIGNEQYEATQLVDEDGVLVTTDVESFMNDLMELVSGDLKFARDIVISGYNRVQRLREGGLDDYQKAAKNILNLGLPGFTGKSIDEVAAMLREQAGK